MRKPRKFNRHTARKIMAGKLRGRIKTRDGRPVRIVAWNALGNWPIVGLICFDDLYTELSWQWTRKGVAFGNSGFDLVIVLQDKSTVPRLRRGPNKKKRKYYQNYRV